MTQRALLIGAPQLHRPLDRLLGVARDIEAASDILTSHGFQCERLCGADARRDAILDRLDELACTSSDAVVVYFSGHGGKVDNTRVVTDLRSCTYQPRYHQFLLPEDFYDHEDAFHGILDIELSVAMARIAGHTRNVTVILDCCHSGGLVRAPGELWAKGIDPRHFNKRATELNHQIEVRLEALRARIDMDGGPRLDADASPDIIRLEAADLDHLAYECSRGGERWGALTLAWHEAVAQHRGQPVSWQALGEEVRERLRSYTGDRQRAGLGGPVHRLPFTLDRAPAPEALALVRRDCALYLHGGSLYGIRPGDRFVVVPPAATRADLAQQLAEVKVVEVAPDMSRVEVVFEPGGAGDWVSARAFLLGPPGAWTGVAVQASGPVRAELARRIEAVPSLQLCRPGDGPVAVIIEVPGELSREAPGEVPGELSCGAPGELSRDAPGDAGPWVEIRDRVGCRVSAPLRPGPAVVDIVRRLQRAAVLRGQESGRGEHALHTPLELRVQVVGASTTAMCRHADGHTTRPEAPIAVSAGTELRCEIASCASPHEQPPQKVYLTIFHVDVDGRIVRRSDAAPTGIPLWAGEPHPLEYRPHSSDDPVRLDWPRDTPRTGPGLYSLIVVAGNRQHTLAGFDTCDLDDYTAALAPHLRDFLREPRDPAMTRSRTGPAGAGAPLCHAVLRVDFLVSPSGEGDKPA